MGVSSSRLAGQREHFYVDVYFDTLEKFYYDLYTHILCKYKVCDVNNLLHVKKKKSMHEKFEHRVTKRADVILC